MSSRSTESIEHSNAVGTFEIATTISVEPLGPSPKNVP